MSLVSNGKYTFAVFFNLNFEFLYNEIKQGLEKYLSQQINVKIQDVTNIFFEQEMNILSYNAHLYKHKNEVIIYTDNCINGYFALIKNISIHNKLKSVFCTISNTGKYPGYALHYFENGNERHISTIKEKNWIFFQKGDIKLFENESYYLRKRKQDRFNFGIMVEYLLKIGIDINDDSFWLSAKNVVEFVR